MTEADGARFVYLLLCLVLVGSAVFARRLQISSTFKMLAIWAGIFAGVYVLFLFRGEGQAVWNRIMADVAGSRGESVGGTLRIRQRDDGHYYVRATIDGVEAELLVDSGATFTTISAKTAAEAGITPDFGPDVPVTTANGTTLVKTGTIGELRVGPIVRRNARVHISTNGEDIEVLGMSFLSTLAGWKVEDDSLTLQP